MKEESLVISPVDISSSHPTVLDCLLSELRQVPISCGSTTSSHPQIPRFIGAYIVSSVIGQPRCISRHDSAARTHAYSLTRVRNENMKHFSRTDTIPDRQTEFALPVFKDLRR